MRELNRTIMDREQINITWAEVKQAYADHVEDGKPVPAKWKECRSHASALEKFHHSLDRADSWYGGSSATPADTLHWMRKGFHAPEFKNAGKYVQAVKKKRVRYDDTSGTLDFDRLMSGDDKFFRHTERRIGKPGLNIIVKASFSAHVSPNIIQAYGAWIAGFLSAIETRGFDMSVDIDSSGTAQWQGGSRNDLTQILMRVKNQGEKSRFSSWSVLFSPTGYRHLVFTGMFVAGDKVGKVPAHNLGYPYFPETGEWKVDYVEESNTVTIRCQSGAREFDADGMTNQAKAAGLL